MKRTRQEEVEEPQPVVKRIVHQLDLSTQSDHPSPVYDVDQSECESALWSDTTNVPAISHSTPINMEWSSLANRYKTKTIHIPPPWPDNCPVFDYISLNKHIRTWTERMEHQATFLQHERHIARNAYAFYSQQVMENNTQRVEIQQTLKKLKTLKETLKSGVKLKAESVLAEVDKKQRLIKQLLNTLCP